MVGRRRECRSWSEGGAMVPSGFSPFTARPGRAYYARVPMILFARIMPMNNIADNDYADDYA